MRVFLAIIVIAISYLIGNISPATLLARAAGKDIKKEGSGNAGTTNVLRVLGAKAAVVTLLIDVTKGFIATKLGMYLGIAIANHFPTESGPDAVLFAGTLSAWCGLAAFLGHIWPILFKFKGGKGVATALGVLLATDWVVALICLGIFILLVTATKMVSLGSICAAAAFPFIYLWKLIAGNKYALEADESFIRTVAGALGPMILPLLIMAIILIVKHKANIGRIIRGEENRISFKKKEVRNDVEIEATGKETVDVSEGADNEFC